MRVIVLDECQMLTPQAQQSILKNLEEPAERTLWILSSMNPEKLNPAIVNRCQQFHLKLMDREAISSRLRYICGEEGIKERVITDSLLNSMADLSGGHMRQAVQLLEATIQYMNGADGIKESEMSEWLRKNVVESALIDSDDNVAARILLCLYLGNTKMLQKSICDATDYFGLAIKLIQLNTYLLDQLMFGAQHRNVWHTFQNKAVWELLQSKVPDRRSEQD
jgi:DNA polymerase III delta prime subunit